MRLWFCLAAILLCAVPDCGYGEGRTAFGTTIDKLEQQLEMGRHEQFLDVRRLPASRLNEFTTDGCSGGLSVGWEYLAERVESFHEKHGEEPAWQSCCITHDRAYHTGGGEVSSSQESFDARKQADLALKECVFQTGAARRLDLSREYGLTEEDVEKLYLVISHLMYRAVRIGGMPCTGLPWRWGYGWPECGEE